jgi:hypothetical protein
MGEDKAFEEAEESTDGRLVRGGAMAEVPRLARRTINAHSVKRFGTP